MAHSGVEPATSGLQSKRTPSWATSTDRQHTKQHATMLNLKLKRIDLMAAAYSERTLWVTWVPRGPVIECSIKESYKATRDNVEFKANAHWLNSCCVFRTNTLRDVSPRGPVIECSIKASYKATREKVELKANTHWFNSCCIFRTNTLRGVSPRGPAKKCLINASYTFAFQADAFTKGPRCHGVVYFPIFTCRA